jgi:hypothetical protein
LGRKTFGANSFDELAAIYENCSRYPRTDIAEGLKTTLFTASLDGFSWERQRIGTSNREVARAFLPFLENKTKAPSLKTFVRRSSENARTQPLTKDNRDDNSLVALTRLLHRANTKRRLRKRNRA